MPEATVEGVAFRRKVAGMWETIEKVGIWLYGLAHAWGAPGLFLVALADSSFLSIPQGTDILVVLLCVGASWWRMLYLVMVTVVGSTLGCALLYGVARGGFQRFVKKLETRQMPGLRHSFRRWGSWTVLVASVLPPPTPFKLFVIGAGVCRFPFGRFLIAVGVGRFLRYAFWGALAVAYGEWTADLMQHRLTLLGVVLFLFLVLGLLGFWWMNRLQTNTADPSA